MCSLPPCGDIPIPSSVASPVLTVANNASNIEQAKQQTAPSVFWVQQKQPSS